VSYFIQSADDVQRVVALFRLNYERPWSPKTQNLKLKT
jgi:hypothetical protein